MDIQKDEVGQESLMEPEPQELNEQKSEDESSTTPEEISEAITNEQEDPGSFEVDVDDNEHNRAIPELSEQELDEVADISIEVIRDLLVYFNAQDAEVDEYEGDEGELIFDIIGENLAVLIGRHGATLDALQYLVSALVSRRLGYRYPVVVDIEGYVHRRKQKLISLAKSSAARAIRQHRDVRLRPMNPYERRIIHVALKNDRRIKTVSEGKDPNRQIVITVL